MPDTKLNVAFLVALGLLGWACSDDSTAAPPPSTAGGSAGVAGQLGAGQGGAGQAGVSGKGGGAGSGPVAGKGGGAGTGVAGKSGKGGAGQGGEGGASEGGASGGGGEAGSAEGGASGAGATSGAGGSAPACPGGCPGGASCQQGQCVCDEPGLFLCGGLCIDLQTSPANCGGCGVVCQAGDVCTGGECGCAAENFCGGVCVDTKKDGNNCGGCGVACGAGAKCEEGECSERVVLDSAAPGSGPQALVVLDGEHVYWATSVELRRVKKDGTEAQKLSDHANYGGLVAGASEVYWTDSGGLFSLAKQDLAQKQLVAKGEPLGSLVKAGEALYFGGLGVKKLTLGQATPVVFDADLIGRGELAADATHLYWGGNGGLHRRAFEAGSKTETVGADKARYTALDGDTIFYGRTYENPGVYSMPKAGGAPKLLLLGVSGPLAPSGPDLYAAPGKSESAADHGAIWRVNKETAEVKVIASEPEVRALAVDDTHLFYVSKGELVRRKK